jgi:LysR family transcriptional regulator, glycine cleavage system transcriptional activator
MPSRRYRLPQLAFFQGFEAAARNLSFTKAAAELFITQSAVSR